MSAKSEKVDPEWAEAPEVNEIYDYLDEAKYLKKDLLEDAMSDARAPADFVYRLQKNLILALGEVAHMRDLVEKVKKRFG